ncbi:hypothetical protein [Micromonospora sp. NPDC048839]|uniref:hypothetical protein n=1 Tax=Micromonospora sp. NPDC048839 TaxID=3155641 RepID=UPI0033CFBE42
MRICVACRADLRTDVRIGRWGLPHGTPGHQVNYRWTSLSACPLCGAGLLVYFDHDCFRQPWEEPWDMDWSWPVAVDGVQQLNAALGRCPDLLHPSCECPVHRSLRDSIESPPSREVPLTVALTEEGLPQVRSARMP